MLAKTNSSPTILTQSPEATTSPFAISVADQGAFQDGILSASSLTGLVGIDGGVAGELATLNTSTNGSIAFQNQDGGDLDAETHQYHRLTHRPGRLR